MKPAKQETGNAKQAGVPGTALLSKTLDVLECIGESQSRMKIGDVATVTGYARPTLYRILAALSARDFIQIDPRDHAYQLGPRFTELAGAIAQHSDLLAVVATPVRVLAETYGEAVNVGVLAGSSHQLVARLNAQNSSAFMQVGEKRPLYCTALGKALLAFQSRDVISRLLREVEFVPLTEYTLTNPSAIETELDAVRLHGFAFDNEEIIEGYRCVAVPVLDGARQAIAAISMSAPTHRMPDARRQDMAVDLKRAATQVEQALLGGRLHGSDPEESAPWLEVIQEMRAFGIDVVIPDRESNVLVLDSAGGQVFRVGDDVKTLFSMSDQIHAMCLSGEIVFFVSGGALWRFDPYDDESAAPVKLAESKVLSGVDGLVPYQGGLAASAGNQLLALNNNGDTKTIASGRLPGTGLKAVGDAVFFASSDGIERLSSGGDLTKSFTFPTEGLRDFELDPVGRAWISRDGAWRLECRAADGEILSTIPMPVPNVSALGWDSGLLAGSERWTLSSSQIDLAPNAGRLFKVRPDLFKAVAY